MAEWTIAHRESYEKFLIDTLSFPEAAPTQEPPREPSEIRG